MNTRRALAGLTLACLSAGILFAVPALARKPKPLSEILTITLSAAPVPLDRDNPEAERFGKLIWRGTVQITSPAAHFGGYSGLALDRTGTRLIAVSDSGTWLVSDIRYRNGRITSLGPGVIGPLLTRSGRPARGREIDAEGLTVRPTGSGFEALIAFEQIHRVGIFPVGPKGIGAPQRYLALSPRAKGARGNVGLEALAILKAGPAVGAILALSEEHLDEDGNHLGWLFGGKQPGQLAVRRLRGFAITGAASLPGGDVVILERRFRYTEGVKMRLRRIAAAAIKPGAVLDSEVLFETDDVLEIDNMEGLAAHADAKGRTILTVISDDNFNSAFQRTLLMQFELPED